MDLDARNQQAPDFSGISSLRGVRALVLVGGRPGVERFGEMPLALLDILGRSVLLRTIDRLRVAGVAEIAVLSDTELPSPRPNTARFSVTLPKGFWEEALQHVRRLARQSECVLLLRLGSWAEVDYAAMVTQHRRSGAPLTQACLPDLQELDVFVISSSSVAEAAALLRGELRDQRIAPALHETSGYVNPMKEPADLRKLVLDSFAGEAAVSPWGNELRPGVWMGFGARVHRDARIVAPAFVGAFCDVHSGAVVTRGSSLEHHSELDCATVVESSSVLPYTRVGAGLDVEQSIVGFRQVHSMQHQITVDIEDPHLIGATRQSLSVRAVSGVNRLLAFLPTAVWKLFFTPEQASSASEGIGASAPVLGDTGLTPIQTETKAYREMATVRRYGDE